MMKKIFFDHRCVYLGESETGGEDPAELVFGFEGRQELCDLLESFRENDSMESIRIEAGDPQALQEAFRSCFKCIGAGGGVVGNGRGAYLLIVRNGYWDLPKGKLEKGEGFEEAALREVEEECGLQGLRSRGLLTTSYHTYPLKDKWVLKETRWFAMDYRGEAQPVLQAEEGITDFRWLHTAELDRVYENTYGSIRDVLKCLPAPA